MTEGAGVRETVFLVAEPPAALGRRVGAYVIDILIAAAVASLAVVGLLMICMPLFGAAATADRTDTSVSLVGVSLIGLSLMGIGGVLSVAWTIVWVLMQGGRGSVGMRLMKIRLVLRATGIEIGFWRALGRHLVFGLLSSVLVGYLTVLFDRSGRRQGWHDLMVGALMIDVPAFEALLAQAEALTNAPAPTVVPLEELHRDRAFGLPVAPPSVPPLPGLRAAGVGVPTGAAPAVGASAAPAPRVIADVPLHLAQKRIPAEAPAPAAPAPRLATIELRWDDGSVTAVPGAAILGRDPVPASDAARVSPRLAEAVSLSVPDGTMSLSKTHFGVGIDRTGAWIIDLHSTNGTALHREGATPRALLAGEVTGVSTGDVAVMGSRRATIVVVNA